MKFLTTNFVQCAVPDCAKSSDAFPLKYEDAQLVQKELDFDPLFVVNMLPKLDWAALVQVAQDMGNNSLPTVKPELEPSQDVVSAPENEKLLRDLHTLLLETQITEGKMVCRNCGFVYYIKNSIANFLLPPHLAK